MGTFQQKEDYLQSFAIGHPAIAHNEATTTGDVSSGNRNSFFRMNDADELLAGSVTWAHFPCMVMMNLTGQRINRNGSIRTVTSNTILFLDQPRPADDQPIISAAISTARDSTFTIVEDFITKVSEDEDLSTCAYFEVGNIKWEPVGPLADNLYGWELTFTDERKPA